MDDEKAILAIETSDIVCGACIYFNEEKYFSASIRLKNSHSEKLLPIIDSLMKVSEALPQQIESIAISEGPGSFTGLRIGMAAAKGIAYGWKIPVIPVPTFEAIAMEISNFYHDGNEFVIANKVNKDEVYLAKFQIKANSYIFVDGLKILDKKQIPRRTKNRKLFGNAIPDRPVRFSSPSPEFVAMWARQFGEKKKLTDFDYLEPNYLKSFIIKEKIK